MSDAGSGAAAAQPPEMRIGDAERQAVIDQLRIHTGAGRLTLDEFSERADAAWRAMTASELAPLLADLPAPRPDPPSGPPPWPPPAPSGRAVPPPPAAPAPPAAPTVGAPPAAPAPATVGTGQRSLVAIMSGNHMKGRWEVAPNLSAFAMWGNVRIDLRQAIIRSQVVDIRATVLMGGIDVIVPEGIPVEVTGLVIMGGASNRVRGELAMPGAPLVRVHVAGLWGGVDVRSKPNPRAKAEPPDDDHRDARGRRDFKAEFKRDLQRDIQRSIREAQREVHRSLHTHPADRRPRGRDRHAEPEDPPTGPLARAPKDLPEGTLTMLFTDIVNSTEFAERLGDQRWAAVLEHHDRTVRAIVAGHGGTVVKGSGDGYLIVFPSARQAVLAAIAIQRATGSVDGAGPEGPILLRAGLHTGEVVQRDGDVFGRNVIAASRIASQAEAGQVLVSSLTKELVESSGDLSFSDGVEMSLRGLARPWTVHEVHEATA
jgi:class 3 adenylate cyclase